MPHTNATAEAIQEMVRFFLPLCDEKSTLRELDDMAGDSSDARNAEEHFQ